MKKVAIVVLDYKNKKDTQECIKSIEHLEIQDVSLSVIVVNNDTSTTYEVKDFSEHMSLTIINSTINGGYTGGNNQGIEQAKASGAEYILLLNNDTIVDKKLLKELLSVLEKDPKIGLISPKIYFFKGNEFHKDRYKEKDLGHVFWYAGGIMDWKNVLGKHRGVDEVDEGQYDTVQKTDFATGCCMFFKTSIIDEVGLFDPKFFLYYEDSDFNQRVKNKGYTIFYAPQAVIWHKNAGSTGGSGSGLQDYFISRNRLLFGMKYAPLRAKIALVREAFSLLTKGRDWQKKAVRDFFLGKFGKGSYPIS